MSRLIEVRAYERDGREPSIAVQLGNEEVVFSLEDAAILGAAIVNAVMAAREKRRKTSNVP